MTHKIGLPILSAKAKQNRPGRKASSLVVDTAAMDWPKQSRGDASPRACSVKRQKQRVGSHTSVADCWEFSSPETPQGRPAHSAE